MGGGAKCDTPGVGQKGRPEPGLPWWNSKDDCHQIAEGTENRSVLFLQNNYLYYPNGEEATTIGACRAYFPLNGIYGGTPDLSIKSFVLNFGDGETSIQEIVNGKSSNGKSDEWYSVDGRKLEGKPTQKGIYIVNGKKMLIK